jgi:hypothetical protein
MKTKALALLSTLGVAAQSHAALDVTAIETSVTADLATISTYAFGILAVSLGLSIGIKLVKKYTNKAT